MENKVELLTCPICRNKFKFGANAYDGKHIKRYNLTVCNACLDGNHDGWAPHYEKILLDHLKEKGLPIPERNSNDLLPRD